MFIHRPSPSLPAPPVWQVSPFFRGLKPGRRWGSLGQEAHHSRGGHRKWAQRSSDCMNRVCQKCYRGQTVCILSQLPWSVVSHQQPETDYVRVLSHGNGQKLHIRLPPSSPIAVVEHFLVPHWQGSAFLTAAADLSSAPHRNCSHTYFLHFCESTSVLPSLGPLHIDPELQAGITPCLRNSFPFLIP